MKLKTIFIVFNLVVVLAFLSIFLVPLFVLGGEYFSFFASRNWIAALLFAVTFVGANLYFLLNWRLFALLEREDWPALVSWLEERIYRRGRLRATWVRLLANAYLLTSSIDGIRRLEAHLAGRRPALLRRHPLPFGLPYLLKSPPGEAQAWFARQAALPGVRQRGWLRWNHAFCLLQDQQPDAARDELLALQEPRSGRDPLLLLLTLFMLDSFSKSDPGVRVRVEAQKQALRRRYPRPRLERVVERSRGNMEVLILSRLVRNALEWLYGAPSGEPVAGSAERPGGPRL